MLIGHSYVFFREMPVRKCCLTLRNFSFSVKCPKTLNHGGAGHTPQSCEGTQRTQRVRIDGVRALFPLPCDAAPALTCGHPLFRDFPKSCMTGDVARTLVLTLKVSLSLWTLRILECSLYNCLLVPKGDCFQDPCGHPSSRILWPSHGTARFHTWIRRSTQCGTNSGFVLGNFLHFQKIIFDPWLVGWTWGANYKYIGCLIPVRLSIQNYFRLF